MAIHPRNAVLCHLHERMLEYPVPCLAEALPRQGQMLQLKVTKTTRQTYRPTLTSIRLKSHVGCKTRQASSQQHPSSCTLKSTTSLAPHTTLAAAILRASADWNRDVGGGASSASAGPLPCRLVTPFASSAAAMSDRLVAVMPFRLIALRMHQYLQAKYVTDPASVLRTNAA